MAHSQGRGRVFEILKGNAAILHLSNTTWSISSRQYTVSALAHTKFLFKILYFCMKKNKYPADILVEQEKRVTASNPIQGFEEALQCLKGTYTPLERNWFRMK